MEVKVNEKIKGISSFLESGDRVADIGCDHGYVLILGALEQGIKKGIGIDIKRGPLEGAQHNIATFGLEEQIEVRLGNGLMPLSEGEVDTIVIAGVGGQTLLDILEASPNVLKGARKLILQPMTEVGRVRSYLKKLGFVIIAEKLIYEDHYYVILVAERGSWPWEEDFLMEIGPYLKEEDSDIMQGYIQHQIRGLTIVLEGLEQAKSTDDIEKRKKKLSDLISCWKGYLNENKGLD